MLKTIISFITGENAYDRNHGSIPRINRDTHCVHIDGEVLQPLSLSVDDLSKSFPQHEVVCTLQCAGNRRHTMRTWLKEVDGLDWGDAAIMNCVWRGPRLSDVLDAAGLRTDTSGGHVQFACHAAETEKDTWYGASIKLDRAMNRDEDVILALEVSLQWVSWNILGMGN